MLVNNDFTYTCFIAAAFSMEQLVSDGERCLKVQERRSKTEMSLKARNGNIGINSMYEQIFL